MSILDTFTIVFEGDNSKAKAADRETQQSAKSTAQAVTQAHAQGQQAAHSEAQENRRLAESFDVIKEHASEMSMRLIEHALEVAAAFKALFTIERMVENFFEQAEISDELGKQAKQMGVSVEELDAWGQMTVRMGGTTQGFVSSLENLNFQLERIAVTGHSRSLKFFEQLGIDATKAKSGFELLLQLREKFEGMEPAKSTAFGRAIGLDNGTIRLLQAEKKEFDELIERQKLFGNITEEDAKKAEVFNDEWSDIKQLFRNIVIDANSTWMPMLYEMLVAVEHFILFLREHKTFVEGFFIATAAAVLLLAEAFGWLDVALAVLFSPITLIVAAIGALIGIFALIYDDLIVFSHGGNSVIGELAKKWPMVGEAAMDFLKILKDVKTEAIQAFTDIIAWANKVPGSFDKWGTMLSGLPGKFGTFATDVGAVLSQAGPAWVEIMKGAFQLLALAVETAWAGVKASFSLLGNILTDPQNAFQNFYQAIKNIIANIVKEFPEIAKHFQPVADAFTAVTKGIVSAFEWMETVVMRIIHAIVDAFNGAVERIKQGGHFITHPGEWFKTTTPAEAVKSGPRADPGAPSLVTLPGASRSELGPLGIAPALAMPLGPRTAAPGILGPVPFRPSVGYAGDNGPVAVPPGFTPPGGPPALFVAPPPAIFAAPTSPVGTGISSGRDLLNQANSPLLTQPGSGDKTVNNTVSIGSITIQTQATDADGIAASLSDQLRQHYEDVLNRELATGVSH